MNPFENKDLKMITAVIRSRPKKFQLVNRKMCSVPRAIGRLTTLVKLDLRMNLLTSLPVEMSELCLLEDLNLANNKFEELPTVLLSLTGLKVLQIYGNHLTELDGEILGSLECLTTLNVNKNNITVIPPEIENLSKLEYFSSSHNRLQEVPSEMCYLQNIRELQLGYNEIVGLPVEFGKLKKLQKLCIHKNELAELPESFCRLYNLRFLDIAANRLRLFPTQFCKMDITELHYESNPLLMNAPVHSIQEEEVLSLKEISVRLVMQEIKDKDSYLRISIRHYPEVREILKQCGKCAVCEGVFLNTWLECVAFHPKNDVTKMGPTIPVRGLLCSYKCFNSGGHGYFGVAFPDTVSDSHRF